MAAANAVRSPLPYQEPPTSSSSLSSSSCAFRRSKSRVYYESEYNTTRTSWEFRGVDSPPLYLYHHQMSVLRSSPHNIDGQLSVLSSCPLTESNSSHNHHRSIPAPPELMVSGGGAGDGSDGSRNSTGSSTGSHRSQDSGFSDSGEGKHSSRRVMLLSSPKAVVGCNGQDANCNYVTTPTNLSSATFVLNRNKTPAGSVYVHESCYSSSPVPPSPIPHCGKIFQKNGGGTFTIAIGNTNHPSSASPITEYEELGNVVDCSNCIYQEIPQPNSNSSQYHHTHQSSEHSGNYFAISPNTQGDKNGQLGTPIGCSTPKRSNISCSTSRMAIMQKIDNFESLNKNQRSLDNNNNSNGNTSSATPTINCSSSGSKSSKKHSKHVSSSLLTPRAPIPLPQPTTPQETHNSSFTQINEFATYASHSSELKSCSKISPKWKNLPKGFKRVSTKDLDSSSSFTSEAAVQTSSSPSTSIIVKSHFDNEAMRLWLHELRSQTENECFYMLQTKSIPNPSLSCDDHDKETGNASDSDSGTYGSQESSKCGRIHKKTVVQAIHDISSPLMSIKNVEQMANVVSAEFAKICKNIEFGFFSQVPPLVINLVGYVDEFLRTFQGSSPILFGNLQKLEHKLSRSCRRLHRSAQLMLSIVNNTEEHLRQHPASIYSIIEGEDAKKGEGYHVAVSEVVDGIVSVGNIFSQVVDLRLTRDLSSILDTIEGGGVPAKVALKSFVTILIDGGNHLCRLASGIRTVRGLLGLILDAKDDYLKILALRCLATVLCVGDAVKDFDRASGFEIVADFMYEPTYSFELKIEAVSVLTQATDPWIDLETSLCTLGPNLEKIVVALTNLVSDCESMEEPFLLVVAAISNLTFLEPSSIEFLRRFGTISLIINAIQITPCTFSVFVFDHVATILANMAGVESCRDCIVKSGGVHALLNFLQKRPTPTLESASEIMACERVQQKSTIAISRLCGEEGVAKLILDRGGLHRLIQLSRNEKERNYSDGVLIAALATLRKLVSICGDEVIRGLQADDLIHPRLLDSFLLYSSRQESYV